MPHPITIPEKQLWLDLLEFHGVAELNADETPDKENSRWGFNYAQFGSAADAKSKKNPLLVFGRVTVKGDLLAQYMVDPEYNGGKGDWIMRRDKVGALLAKLFSQSLTQSEFEDVLPDERENLRLFREQMAGKPMFRGAITITALEVTPDE